MDITNNTWIAIKEVVTVAEASIIKGLLESEGIPVFVKQEAYGKTGIPGIFSGIQIMVLREHAREAVGILLATEFEK